MNTKLQPEYLVSTLKKCIKWKNDQSIKTSKAVLNIYMDFLKLRIIPKNDSARKSFNEYTNNPLNERLEGKLEVWLETGLKNNTENKEDLLNKIEKVESFNNSTEINQTNNKVEDKQIIANDTTKKISTKEIFDDIDDDDELFETELKDPIIVPWDFSEVAGYALKHALLYAPILGGQIYLLHIVKKDKDIDSATAKLEKLADETFNKYKIRPNPLVKTGNIFTSITEIANKNRAKMVIMGTHGIKGMQKLTGSWALKVIAGTNTPFIVVQKAPEKQEINDIVFPVNHLKENKQKLKQAKKLAQHYNLKFTLVVAKGITNAQFIKNTKTNLNYVKSFFRQNEINYEVKAIEGTDDSIKATLMYAAENKPDLIMILTTKNINIQDYVLGADEQKIIANPDNIPVMCINPKKVIFSSYGGFGGSK